MPQCGRKPPRGLKKPFGILNYQPDRLAARLAKGKEYRFCFVLPEGNNSFMIELGEEVRANRLAHGFRARPH